MKTKSFSEDDFNDWLHEASDIRGSMELVESDLECAESCDKVEDFAANVSAAINGLEDVLKRLRELKKALPVK